MADETTDPLDENAIDPEPGAASGFTQAAENERQRRRARFAELGGGRLLDEDVKRAGKLEDVVTDLHRRLVRDMAAADLSQDIIAKILGISRERLQTLFEHELATGFEQIHGAIIRTMGAKAMMGDTFAGSIWLRNHNRSMWREKREQHNTDDAETGDGINEQELNESFMAGVIAGLLTDKSIKRIPGNKREPAKVLTGPVKPVKIKTIVRKPKGD